MTHQEIHAAALDLEHRSCFGRRTLIRTNGGKVSPAVCEGGSGWQIEMLGIEGTGPDVNAAISSWIRAARVRCNLDPARRATDWRHDCPYNGQAPLPEQLPPCRSLKPADARTGRGYGPGPF
ncbi:hypothetical protein VWX96_17100 [Phaeobacter sp. A90a-4f]|uniref:hypothetical protein n=1 Tax=unclassified Phaeobacter TaxID=2621772 RepID=UPI003A86E2C6